MSETAIFTPEQRWMPGFIANPYPTYHHLRDQSPLNFLSLPAGAVSGSTESMRGWALLKYADVYSVLWDPDALVSGRNPRAGKAAPKLVLLHDDPPCHTRFRRLVNKTFTLKNSPALPHNFPLAFFQTLRSNLKLGGGGNALLKVWF